WSLCKYDRVRPGSTMRTIDQGDRAAMLCMLQLLAKNTRRQPDPSPSMCKILNRVPRLQYPSRRRRFVHLLHLQCSPRLSYLHVLRYRLREIFQGWTIGTQESGWVKRFTATR